MSKKFYLITLAITILVSAIIVYSFIYSRKVSEETIIQETSQEKKENSYLILPIEELSKKDKLSIQTEKGTVDIVNVYKSPISKLSKNGVEFVKNEDYAMDFYPEDEGFLIILSDSDVISTERKAGREFVSKLGISEKQACELKVSITVPVSVNEQYGGGVYGFSFCPNANHIK